MSSNNKTINCLNLSYIFKVSLGSINGSTTEGNIATIKKITLPNGDTLPYISGQSMKYQIRRKLEDKGYVLSSVTKSEAGGKGKAPDISEGNPDKNIDDDLFGYLIPEKGGTRRRTAPVRVTPAIGLFKYANDRDFGTKSKEQSTGDSEAGGNIFETEIYNNFFRGTVLVESDRVGQFLKSETKGKENVNNTTPEVRKKRVTDLFDSIATLWGGGKQGRFLTDMSPKFFVFTAQTDKTPIFLETLLMSPDGSILLEPIKEVLDSKSSLIETTIIGLQSGIFANETEIKEQLKTYCEIKTISAAMNGVTDFINKMDWEG
jgi:CRISPR-associated protein Cst2